MSDPLTRLVELTVYAPIGLVAVAREHLPDYVEQGRNRVEQRLTLARFIGQMVVTQGRRELERRLAESAERPSPTRSGSSSARSGAPRPTVGAEPGRRTEALRSTAAVGTDPVPSSDPASASEDTVTRGAADAGVEPMHRTHETDLAADALPIEGYESLAAAQVVARLADLDADGLDLLERFERSHRNRRTVLHRIEQLRSAS